MTKEYLHIAVGRADMDEFSNEIQNELDGISVEGWELFDISYLDRNDHLLKAFLTFVREKED